MHKVLILAAFAVFTSIETQAELPPFVEPSSPRDLAAMLENRIVSGEWVVLPDADVPIVLDSGSIRLCSGAWPDVFIQHDSGDPLFVSLGADLVLLGTLHTATSVDDCSAYIGGIQAIMNELCAGYSVQTLSFDDYPVIQEILRHE